MKTGTISARIFAPPNAHALLEAAVAELAESVAEGLAPGAADRLNGTAGLVEEAMVKLEGPRP